jgi:hypothetical protein
MTGGTINNRISTSKIKQHLNSLGQMTNVMNCLMPLTTSKASTISAKNCRPNTLTVLGFLLSGLGRANIQPFTLPRCHPRFDLNLHTKKRYSTFGNSRGTPPPLMCTLGFNRETLFITQIFDALVEVLQAA